MEIQSRSVKVTPEVAKALLDQNGPLPPEMMNAPIAFGLKAQGHLHTVQEMLAGGFGWEDIGKVIGWEPKTAQRHYLLTLLLEAADSVHGSLAETDISDDRKNYRKDLERRLRVAMEQLI